jgi:HEAT repeat protein
LRVRRYRGVPDTESEEREPMKPVLLLGLVVMATGLIQADDEPTFLDRKLSDWLKLLHEGKDAKSRRRGVVAVEQIGHAASKKVVPALLRAFREDSDPVVRAAAGRAVARAAVRALEQARQDKAESLPRFDNVRDALVAALRTDKEGVVREAAAAGLGLLGTDARGATAALGQALRDPHEPTVRAAASALRRMGREAGDAQAELVALLRNGKADEEARTEAALALGQINFEASTLAALREVIRDGKAAGRIRRAAIESVGKLGKEAGPASSDLAALLVGKDTPEELRLAAVTALEQLGAEAKPAIPALIQTLSDPQVVKLLGDNARIIRCLAMQSLTRIGGDLDGRRKEVVRALLGVVEEPGLEVCVSAIEALGALSANGLGDQTEEVVKRLDAVLQREGRKAIREAAEAARNRIRPEKKG